MKKVFKPYHEFKALKLNLDEKTKNGHTIYFKEHSVRDHSSDKPSGRTLLILNIPPYVDEQGLKNAFSAAGTTKSVRLSTKPSAAEAKFINRFIPEISKPCFHVAYLVFDKVSQLHKALALHNLQPLNNKNYQVSVGMKKWINEYNTGVSQPKVLQENIETFMTKFDAEAQKANQKEKDLEQEDDEGWVTVTKKSKVQSFARSENVENKIMAKEEKNKKRKELKNFYTFQIRESKMKHIVALRQKFEEDKQKIAQIKQSRRFKPF